MPLLIVALGVALLLVLMVGFKLEGFISLVLVAIVVGLLNGLTFSDVVNSVEEGIGGQLGHLALIIGFGAMLGKLMADCGAAQRIAMTLTAKFGEKRLQWAILITAFVLGVTLFFEIGFILLIPIVFTIVSRMKVNLLYIGLPMAVALSTTHSFLPPHPGPAAVASVFGASMGKTLLLGLVIAIPSAIIAGILFSKTKLIRAMNPAIPEGLYNTKEFKEEEMPSFGVSLFTALVPIVLMAVLAVAEMVMPQDSGAFKIIAFFGESGIALLISVLIAIYTFGIARGRKMKEIMGSVGASLKSIATIMFVIGGGGAFKQVLVDSGVADYIKNIMTGLDISPLILAWIIAAVLRLALGSATVTVMTASGIVLPLLGMSGASPELMVLATTSGSVIFSHVNDPGFWMYKEYFNLSLLDAIKSRSVYTTILAVCGLLGVLALNAVMP
ncbi:gluconate:H+ symporter [Paenibacillus sp. FSL R5-0527]|uniref:gluconate:H+ symporter n=1 Tax=Paenibacillus sp. FSL R5-0527 TaxID=2975321 RepID=UPI00097AC001|nr:gluconate transporter [Paenibacillus macerans]